MMQFDMSDPNPPIRVFLSKGEDSEKDPYLDLRPAPASVLKKIRKKTHTRRFKNVRGAVHEHWDVDEDQYDCLLWEYCMPGWGNLGDGNGNLIEYSPDNAVLLLDIPYFSSLVGEKMDEVRQIIEDRVKATEKN